MLEDFFDVRDLNRFDALFREATPWTWVLGLHAFLVEQKLQKMSHDEIMDGLARLERAGVNVSQKHGPVIIREGAKIDSGAIIQGPCLIETGVHIGHHTLVRANCILMYGSVVGHCSEIKNTILFPEAKLAHRNYVGDSVIGRNVNFGDGSGVANTRADSRTIRLHWNGEWVDTGQKKFGAIVGDDSFIGCRVTLNPGTVLGRNCFVHPNLSVHGVHSRNTEFHPLQSYTESVRAQSKVAP